MPTSLNTRLEPDTTSNLRERPVKDSYLLEHNIEGQKFNDGKITTAEWLAFQKDWDKRFRIALHEVVKIRVYEVKEDV